MKKYQQKQQITKNKKTVSKANKVLEQNKNRVHNFTGMRTYYGIANGTFVGEVDAMELGIAKEALKEIAKQQGKELTYVGLFKNGTYKEKYNND